MLGKPFHLSSFARILFGVVFLSPGLAQAEDVIVGVNLGGLKDVKNASLEEQQNATLSDLKAAGVHFIRTGIGPDDKGFDFVKRIYAQGIKLDWVVGLRYRADAPKREWNPREWPNMYAGPGLSEADPEQFRTYFQTTLDKLDAAGIALAAFELGNELNMAAFNPDFPLPGKGKLFGADDLKHDPVAQQIAKGYLQYLKLLAALKDIRDHSKLNQHTPILTAGFGAWEADQFAPGQSKVDMVNFSTTLDFMRENGLDKLVDGYAVHVYPWANGPGQDAAAQGRRNRLAKYAFAECRPPGSPDGKPCWVTEWGFKNTDSSCPPQEANQVSLIKEMRDNFRPYIQQRRLTGLFYYAWIDTRENFGLFRCGALMQSGRLAITPFADAVPEALTNSGRILPRAAQTFRGWGMSLSWEANYLYGGGRQPAQMKDPKMQSEYMDLLYGDPATRLTLGFNVARYNIGGGDDPTHTHMRADTQMEGFQAGPGAPFDWTRDAGQRHMLHEAIKRGANILEAFSVGPPFWMTVSGCASGNKAGQKEDNLRADMQETFVSYLTTIVKHFRDVEGVRFESLEPFNEPDIGWGAGGSQEGYSASLPTRNALIPMLAARLKQQKLKTFVSGLDTNNIDSAVGSIGQLTPGTFAVLGRLNTHDYHGASHWTRPQSFREIAWKSHKPVWMSELGCCFPNQGDKTEMWGALFIADSIRVDLRDLGAEAWVQWQTNFNVVSVDPKTGGPHLKKQFYTLAQYTRFIRPGFQVISAGGAYNTLAAYSPSAKRLVLVSTNWDTASWNDLDLTAFERLPSAATAYRTTQDDTVNLREERIAISGKGHILDALPIRSVTTYVIDGATPRSEPSSQTIQGPHEIASEAANLCFNIPQDSTRSGEGIIPYPCVDFTNEVFNFVDRGEGFYSIHTVNGPVNLCLNISNDARSPGDGKILGAPGNLIQWTCGDGSIPPNELFKVVDLGAGRVQIHVKSSGLCLDDPGRGGTIRQNRCTASSPNQTFVLTE